MICPNCGLNNPPNARFCANCGTTLSGSAPPPPNPGYTPQPGGQYNQGSSQPYNMSGGYNVGGTRMSPARAIGLGCLILVLLFFVLPALTCSRACFRYGRHSYIRRTF
ncbi:MAG: zinc ribbon domain-containing protein [Acidobacteriaceae bacterium]|nr:zinc ribbon domain-containing protein [Acidobacteriaceae bacterium]